VPNSTSIIYAYSDIVFIEFNDSPYGDYSGSFEMRVVEDRKIKRYLFYSHFKVTQVRELAKILVTKKVPLKLNSFDY
jgi:hypothetical protein